MTDKDMQDYCIFKISGAKSLANEAKRQGKRGESIAWHHTVMAYEDILERVKKG